MTKLANKVVCSCGKSFTRQGLAKHKCDGIKPEFFYCEFCKQDFINERRLINHLCEQKRRYLQRDDKAVKLGFLAYDRFYQRSMGRRKPQTYESFAKSTLYSGFVRFGKHLIDINALNLIGFIDFLLRIEAPIDKWISTILYATYVRELNKTEPALDALERNFMLMQEWAVSTGAEWFDFFRKVEPALATLWISSGRISPWVLFTASSAHDLLARFSPEQTGLVEKAIDPEFWRLKLERHQQEVEVIRSMLAENGI